MKKVSKYAILSVLLLSTTALIVGCNRKTQRACEAEYKDVESYKDRKVDVYREAGKVDKKFTVRFYEKTPNIPFVNVVNYYKEFLAHNDYKLDIKDSIFELKNRYGNFIRMDSKTNIITLNGSLNFGDHTESISSTGQLFINVDKYTTNGYIDKVIDLDSYGIDIHSDDDNVYLPLSFLDIFSGASWFYNVAYNGNAIFVLDRQGVLSKGESRSPYYYGDTYLSPLRDFSKERPQDVIDYTYGQLCCVFDHFRGYTSQLVFGDNNLLSLGADGLLEEYWPNIKKLLLSSNKEEYYAGYNLFLGGMFDGGHTANMMPASDNDLGRNAVNKLDEVSYAKEIEMYEDGFVRPALLKSVNQLLMGKTKSQVTDYVPAITTAGNPNYYQYESTTQTAFIGFDSFSVDNAAWDEFYKNKKSPSEAPVATDAYAFIRSKFYQAKEDGAKNLVLDLTTNGGGNTASLLGIMGLFNKGKGFMAINDTANKTRISEYVTVDINLDGKYDDADVAEASKFDFNFGVMTSSYSFSCANLLPSLLHELGIKMIGQRSGGGSCSIISNATPDGLLYAHSSHLCLSNAKGENIDGGVPVDKEMPVIPTSNPAVTDYSQFYNLTEIGEYLSTAYAE